jgi:hypothetical protein
MQGLNQCMQNRYFCRENVCFSTIVFFETVLLDVRNQKRNVFD